MTDELTQTNIYRTQKIGASILVLIGILATAAGLWRLETNMEDVLQWLPDRSPDRAQYDRFCQLFGTDDFLVVRWSNCRVDSVSCDDFVRCVRDNDEADLISKVESGRDLIRRLRRSGHSSTRRIMEQFRGTYFGSDLRDTCVVVVLTDAGMANRKQAVSLIVESADQIESISNASLVLAGYPVIARAADVQIRESLWRAFLPCCLLSTIAAWICLRDIRIVFAILVVSGLTAGVTIAVITLSGYAWGIMTSIIPSLAYVLAISGSLHLYQYATQVETSSFHDPDGNSTVNRYARIMSHGWKPCLISSLTTAMGMFSMLRSDFSAIRNFAWFCGLGVLVGFGFMITVMPVALALLGGTSAKVTFNRRRYEHLSRAVFHHSTKLLLAFLAVAILLALGVPMLRTNLELERAFTSNNVVLQDIQQIERTIGPVDQTELVVCFESVDPEQFAKRVAWIRSLQEKLNAQASIDHTVSIVNALPPPPDAASIGDVVRRTAYRKRLGELRGDPELARYLAVQGDQECWRISIRFPFMATTDFLNLQQSVAAEFSRHCADLDRDILKPKMTHTGVSMLYHSAQEELVTDLFWNFTTAFSIVMVTMIIVFGSVSFGMLVMLPNLLPSLALFGSVGWIGYPIDLGIAIMACITLGIAVDDTTHLVVSFRRSQPTDVRGWTNGERLRTAVQLCGPAMVATTVVICVGFSAFLATDLASMARCAWSILLTLIVALVADLLLTPALLAQWSKGRP